MRRISGWLMIGACAALPFGAAAQEGSRAGAGLGRMLFGNPASAERAFEEGALQGAIMRQQVDEARAANAEARRVEQDNAIRSALAKTWVKAGFAEGEAAAMASAYQYQPVEQAIVARAKRDGSKATIEAIRAAYANYNYLLADQLLIGYFYAAEAEKGSGQ